MTEGKRISFKDETKLGLMTSEDEAAAVERRASSAAAGPRPPDFHFICEVCREFCCYAHVQSDDGACGLESKRILAEESYWHPCVRRHMQSRAV